MTDDGRFHALFTLEGVLVAILTFLKADTADKIHWRVVQALNFPEWFRSLCTFHQRGRRPTGFAGNNHFHPLHWYSHVG